MQWLFSFPVRARSLFLAKTIEILLRKAIVWGTAAGIYTLSVIVVVAVLAGGVDIDSVVGGVAALVGVAIYAAIARPCCSIPCIARRRGSRSVTG